MRVRHLYITSDAQAAFRGTIRKGFARRITDFLANEIETVIAIGYRAVDQTFGCAFRAHRQVYQGNGIVIITITIIGQLNFIRRRGITLLADLVLIYDAIVISRQFL